MNWSGFTFNQWDLFTFGQWPAFEFAFSFAKDEDMDSIDNSLRRNKAGQGVFFRAFDEAGNLVTGDAENITSVVSLDGATAAEATGGAVVEISPGLYCQPLAQAETNAVYKVAVIPASATSGVRCEMIVSSVGPQVVVSAGSVAP